MTRSYFSPTWDWFFHSELGKCLGIFFYEGLGFVSTPDEELKQGSKGYVSDIYHRSFVHFSRGFLM